MLRRSAVGVVVAALSFYLLAPSPAWADVAPPPDYVEQCTRAKVEQDAEYCELESAGWQDPFGCLAGQTTQPADVEACRQASTYDQDDCCAEWITAGWTYRCNTWGGSSWQSLWCRARQEGDPPRPPDETAGSGSSSGQNGDDGGCAIDPGASRSAVWGLLALAGLGLVGASRRLRRR